MIRQYGPQRFTMETLAGRSVPIGTIPVGTTARIGISPHTMRTRPVLILGWLPREYTVARRRQAPSGYADRWVYENTYLARGGHLAVCRDLSNGTIIRVSDIYLHESD